MIAFDAWMIHGHFSSVSQRKVGGSLRRGVQREDRHCLILFFFYLFLYPSSFFVSKWQNESPFLFCFKKNINKITNLVDHFQMWQFLFVQLGQYLQLPTSPNFSFTVTFFYSFFFVFSFHFFTSFTSRKLTVWWWHCHSFKSKSMVGTADHSKGEVKKEKNTKRGEKMETTTTTKSVK